MIPKSGYRFSEKIMLQQWALPLGNPGEAQPRHVALAVALVFDRIDLPEPFDREARLERQQFLHIRPRLVTATEMAERGDQRLVAVGEVRTGLNDGAGAYHRFFIVSGECIRDRMKALRPCIPRI